MSFDFADPVFVTTLCTASILLALLFDAPAIASTVRLLRRKRRITKAARASVMRV